MRTGITAPRRLAEVLLIAALLAGHGWLAVSSAAEKSVTFDEVAHIGAGVLYWQTGDYRFNAESGILPQRWAAEHRLEVRGEQIFERAIVSGWSRYVSCLPSPTVGSPDSVGSGRSLPS